jgi:TPR repeat protein
MIHIIQTHLEEDAQELWKIFELRHTEITDNEEDVDVGDFWQEYELLIIKAKELQKPILPKTNDQTPPDQSIHYNKTSLAVVFSLIIIFTVFGLYYWSLPPTKHIKAHNAHPKTETNSVLSYNNKQRLAKETFKQKTGNAVLQPSLNYLHDLLNITQEAQAYDWYQSLARSNNPWAQHQLALLYKRGFMRNKDMAVHWFEKSAQLGLAEAQYHLGSEYYLQDIDTEKSIYWLTQSANQGYINACFMLGSLYETKQDSVSKLKALYWHLKAATQGDQHSQSSLATTFMLGNGVVPRNQEMAMYWALRSAVQGNKGGEYVLKMMVGSSKAEQLVETYKDSL